MILVINITSNVPSYAQESAEGRNIEVSQDEEDVEIIDGSSVEISSTPFEQDTIMD